MTDFRPSAVVPTTVSEAEAECDVIAAVYLPARPGGASSHLVAYDRSPVLAADGQDVARPFAVAQLVQDSEGALLVTGPDDLTRDEALQVFADALNNALAQGGSATP
jgi:hypothetical protein